MWLLKLLIEHSGPMPALAKHFSDPHEIEHKAKQTLHES